MERPVTSYDFGADLDAMVADPLIGVDVTYGTQTVRGTIEDQDVVESLEPGMTIVQREQTLLIRTGALRDLEVDKPITVDGRTYAIRERKREPPDGALTRITLADA